MLRGIVAAALLCALAGVAHADNKQAAKEAYSEGKRHYDLGEYDAALSAFKTAYLNYEEPVFLFNIAQCYRALGDRPAAVRSYRAFLRNWPKAPNRDQVERIIAELDAAEAEEQAAKAPAATAPAPAPAPSPPPPIAPPIAPPTTSAAAAATAPASKPATKRAAPRDELAGMIEVEPNFERPSGSAKAIRWWGVTLIVLASAAVVGAVVAISVTQSSSRRFDSTLPDFTVHNQALAAVKVRF